MSAGGEAADGLPGDVAQPPAADPATQAAPAPAAPGDRSIVRPASVARAEVELDDTDEEDAEGPKTDSEGEDGAAEGAGGAGDGAAGAEPPPQARRADQYAARNQYSAVKGRPVASRPRAPDEAHAALKVDAASSASCLPEKKGWVDKASPSYFKGWQRRWFELTDRRLRWYQSDDDAAPKGEVDFDMIKVELELLWTSGDQAVAEAKKARGKGCFAPDGSCALRELLMGPPGFAFRISPTGSNRAFELRLDSQEEADAWVSAIEQHVQQADSRLKRSPCGLDSFGRGEGAWWKVSRISPQRFVQVAETGDVLLFRSGGSMPRLIRAASGKGRYDHVAMCLKLASGDVGLLEATGNNGVGLVEWKTFLANDWHNLYPEMALRRVFFRRSPETIKQLQDWCHGAIGKPYALTVKKLRQRNSVSQGGGDTNEDFFCSQLVAEGLKVAGVITRGKSSTQYWPNSFSALARPPIQCEPGASFGAVDLTIDFSLLDPAQKPKRGGGTAEQRDATTNW